MKRTLVHSLWLYFCCLCLAEELQARVCLSSIWGDNMVLQQQAVVVFRGTAKAGKKVTVTASWDKKTLCVYSDRQGHWSLSLVTPQAGGPYTIRFYDGEELVLRNILIGEVWFCSGQSNMEMPVRGFRGQPVYGSQPYIVGADSQRQLRLFTVKRDWSTLPKEEGITGHWSMLSPKEVGDFSATAYFFGELLQRSLQVPVGLVHCSWSASKIEAWMDRKTLEEFPEVQLPDVSQTSFEWQAGTPTLLWNAMVHPWRGFPVKGVIWYQGEANSVNPALYKRLFPAMVEQWRRFFGNPSMPLYYVQLAPWVAGGKEQLNWAWFRQCQLELMDEIPGVGMVTTTDAGSDTCIHPPHKIKVGQRLAYWALARTYDKNGFLYSGPICRSHRMQGNVVELTFEHGSEGLIPENKRLEGFELVDAEGRVLPAEAEIVNGSARVKVWNDSVTQPVEVRYCFRNYMEGSLRNNADIPASPFRWIVKR